MIPHSGSASQSNAPLVSAMWGTPAIFVCLSALKWGTVNEILANSAILDAIALCSYLTQRVEKVGRADYE